MKWKPVGPYSITGDQNGYAGRILSIIIANGAMLLGTDGGGIWQSGDFDTNSPTWTARIDQVPEANVITSFAIDSIDPKIVYAGSGIGPYIIKSVDGGTTWLPPTTVTGLSGPVSKVYVNPIDNSLYAGGLRGIYKYSQNLWENISNGLPLVSVLIFDFDFTIDHVNNLTLYAVTSNGPDKLCDVWFNNSDGQNPWQKMNITLIDLAGNIVPNASLIYNASFASDHSVGNANGIYLALGNASPGHTLINVFKLNNGKWQPSGNGLFAMNIDSGLALGIAADGRLYLGGVNTWTKGIFQSDPTGTNWISIDTDIHTGLKPHTDFHAWGFFKGGIYCGNDGGIYRFTPVDQTGGTWNGLNTPSLQNVLVQGVGIHPHDATLFLAGSQDQVIDYKDKGGKWREVAAGTDGDTSKVLYDPINGQYAYTTGVSNYSFFYRSDDGGHTFADKSPKDAQNQQENIGWYAPFAIHPSNSSKIAVGINRVWITPDRGETWSMARINKFSPNQSNAIAYGANDSIWVAYANNIFQSPNAGGDGTDQNWLQMNTTPFGGDIIKIIIDSWNPNVVYIALSNGFVFKGTLDNQNNCTWNNITGDLPPYPSISIESLCLIHMLPLKGSSTTILFAGTNIGLYTSFDEGVHWNRDTMLPYARVTDLQYAHGTQDMAVAIYGRGIYVGNFTQSLKTYLLRPFPFWEWDPQKWEWGLQINENNLKSFSNSELKHFARQISHALQIINTFIEK